MSYIESLCINTMRVLSAEAVEKAKSGHPGLPLGASPMAFELWSNHMKHSPKNPKWINRDRFVLSAGHGSMLLYSLLHLFNYGLTIEDIKEFRQLGSKTPGHPEYGHTAGVETTTGPLGQGFANAVGMAIAEEFLASKFNRPGLNIIDHYTYVLCGDGCLMEGISSEAASLAGHLGLGKLIVLYDDNDITIEGCTDITFTEDVGKRFEAYGWQVLHVEDGNDTEAIGKAIEKAKAETGKPSIIITKTLIGYGCPAKQGKASSHGEPLGVENVQQTKEFLQWPSKNEFEVPAEVYEFMEKLVDKLNMYEDEWNKMWEAYKEKYPDLAEKLEKWFSGKYIEEALKDKSLWEFEGKVNATRNHSGDILNRIAQRIPNLIGGSADLAPSNKSEMKNKGDFSREDRSGANLHFGVREHAMAAIANGIAVHGGLLPYVATFFVFTDYMKGAMRLSALMGLPVIYILTHDSIGVGEDGPTHQPIEQLVSLRSVPNFTTFRPCDSTETAAGWYAALENRNGPTALILTRQNLPEIPETNLEKATKGAYILADSDKETPDMLLIASGSEVALVYEARKVLKEKGIDARVISMPSWELFEKQPAEYKNAIMPASVRKRLAVEALSPVGWHKYVGLDGNVIGMDTFGASGPNKKVFEHFGFTVDNIVNKALEVYNI